MPKLVALHDSVTLELIRAIPIADGIDLTHPRIVPVHFNMAVPTPPTWVHGHDPDSKPFNLHLTRCTVDLAMVLVPSRITSQRIPTLFVHPAPQPVPEEVLYPGNDPVASYWNMFA